QVMAPSAISAERPIKDSRLCLAGGVSVTCGRRKLPLATVRTPFHAAPGIELRDEAIQPVPGDRLAQAFHQPLVVAQVVHGGELAAEDLVAAVEMAQVGAAEAVAAGVTVAALLD